MLTTTMLALLIAAAPAPIPPAEATVVEVIDGDTIDVTVDGVAETVRLIGIDAPEVEPVRRPGGQRASSPPCSPTAPSSSPRAATARTVTATTDCCATSPTARRRPRRSMPALAMIATAMPSPATTAVTATADTGWRSSTSPPTRRLRCDHCSAATRGQGCHSFSPRRATPRLPSRSRWCRRRAGGNVFYQNCDAVRAAGAAPIHPGDPGWQDKFDRDNDGVGCE